MTGPPRVMLVEDQELVRDGFRMILERSGLAVVAEAADGDEALAVARTLPATDRPDVVLMDVRMPRMNGIEATGHLLRLWPGVKVIALTTFDLDEYVFGAVKAGASGFLLKHVSPADLVRAVQAAARGDTVLAPGPTRRLLERFATVKTYVSRILAKLDLRDRVQVAVLAYESGLVQPGRAGATD